MSARAKQKATKGKGARVPLAWMGWSLRIPPEWRPVRIEGGWKRGTMLVGDAGTALMQLKWWRPLEDAGLLRRLTGPGSRSIEKGRIRAGAWIAKRLRRVSRADASAVAPQPRGFTDVAWVESADRPGLWYGYAPEAGLLIEAVVRASAPKRHRSEIVRGVLPSLRAAPSGQSGGPDRAAPSGQSGGPDRAAPSGPSDSTDRAAPSGPSDSTDRAAPSGPSGGPVGGETTVAIFGASFTMPAGFRTEAWHLHLGDIALRTRSRSGSQRGTLTVRQVYPAELALSRRSLARWQEADPFPQRRKFRPLAGSGEEPAPCVVEVSGRELRGVRRRGVRRLPVPLGWLRPLRSVAVAVHDTEIGRLLLAEYETEGDASEDVAIQAIAGMNWAMGAAGAAGPSGRREPAGSTARARSDRDGGSVSIEEAQ